MGLGVRLVSAKLSPPAPVRLVSAKPPPPPCASLAPNPTPHVRLISANPPPPLCASLAPPPPVRLVGAKPPTVHLGKWDKRLTSLNRHLVLLDAGASPAPPL